MTPEATGHKGFTEEELAQYAGVDGTCCACGDDGQELIETPCPKSEDGQHCNHWYDGPDEDAIMDQSRWLREFAEALGAKEQGHKFWLFPLTDGRAYSKELNWLVTWPAVEYLVERARAEGYISRFVTFYSDGADVVFRNLTPVEEMKRSASFAATEPLATALAVCKALFPKVKLPEGGKGLSSRDTVIHKIDGDWA